MEDTPDKVRRNVVVLSTLILATWIFEPQMPHEIKLLGTASLAGISGPKIWLCTIAALIYMFLRYRFDKNTSQQLSDMKVELHGFREKLIVPKLRQAIWAFLKGEIQSAHAPALKEIEKLADIIQQRIPDTKVSDLEISEVSVTLREPVTWHAEGTAWLGVMGQDKTGQIISEGIECSYKFPARLVPVITVWPLMRLCWFTKSSVDVVVPCALFWPALLTSIIHLYAA